MRTLILTGHSEGGKHQELAELTRSNKQAYANKHGYDFVDLVIPYCKAGFLQHLDAIKNALNNYERVMTVGADVLFMNHKIALDSFDHFPVTIAREHNCFWPVNNDVMIWTTSSPIYDGWKPYPPSLTILERLIQDVDLWMTYCWYWQIHIWNLRCEEEFFEKHINIVEARAMNSTLIKGESEFQCGDFILHLLGMPNENKIALAKTYLKLAGKCDGSFDPREFPEIVQLGA